MQPSAAQRAREGKHSYSILSYTAQSRRSKEKNKKTDMNQYYYVVGGFLFVMVAAFLYTVLNPPQQFATMPIINESSILVHNGQSHRFKQASNEFFQNWTIADAKTLFEAGLSDTQNLENCRSGTQGEDVPIPEAYDWREKYPHCVRETSPLINRTCASSYVQTTLSAVEDRICMGSKKHVQLSAQEILDCDKTSNACKGGYVNRVLAWGKRRGYVPETCYTANVDSKAECTLDSLAENECRQALNIYKVVDYCLANKVEGVKREIMANGPVISQISPYTDFLVYSSGDYQRTSEAFKYNGNHVVKVLGWEKTPDGATSWIIENSWGESWGEKGFGKVLSNGETMLDYYGVGLAVYPTSIAEYQQSQQQQQYEQAETQQFSVDEGDYFDFDKTQQQQQQFQDEGEEVIDEEL